MSLSRRSALNVFIALACSTTGGDAASSWGAAASAADSDGQGPLSWFANSITQGNSNLLWALRDAFQRAEPSISVEVIPQPPSSDSMRSTLEAVLRAGSREPDVFLGDVIWPAEFGAAGYALALDASLGRSFFDRFPADVVRSAQYGGHVYAAPLYNEQGLLYYRKDILARHGMTPPTTWEQLVSASNALAAAGEKTYQFGWQGAPYEGLTCNWVEYLADRLGTAGSQRSFAEQMGRDGAVEALTFMRDLVRSRVSPSEVVGWQELESINAFRNGQVAFLRAWNSSWDTIAEGNQDKQNIGVAQLPRFANTPDTPSGPGTPGSPGSPADGGFSTLGGWSMYINPRTANLDAALAFVSWMTDRSAQRILATQGGLVPANKDVRYDPSIDSAPPLQVARKSRIVVRPSGDPAYPAITRAVYQNVHQALIGRATPAESLKAAREQLSQAR